MAVATPARNSSTRSGMQAMPRSPASQSPAGKLCSTSAKPWASRRFLMSAASNAYGNRNSTAVKPALAARSNRSRKGTSVNSIVRLAAIFGISLSSIEHGHGGGRVGLAGGQFLELGHIINLGAHRDVGHALEDHLDHDRHLEFNHPGLGLPDRGRNFLLPMH